MQGERACQKTQEIMRETLLNSGRIDRIMFSTSNEPLFPDEDTQTGKYLVLVDPLEGSDDLEVNTSAGTVFSIFRVNEEEKHSTAKFLCSSNKQICAGYVIYGPVTMLVITVGDGTHGFTLDPTIGEFVFTHPNLFVAETADNFAINSANSRFWSPAIKRYVDECIAGDSGSRGREFSMRWIDSLVCETHRILLRGGVFMNPMDGEVSRPGQAKLHYHANPIAMLIEQAGGVASNGKSGITDIDSNDIDQQVGLIFGSKEEVNRIEEYHQETAEKYDAPLFGDRGLFRD
jgi:fructose-1,6-bisphosphatase I/sedoheptulose-1,7-bisphosphatase